MAVIRFETALWNALDPADKVSRSGVNYTPAVEYDRTGVDPEDVDDLGTPTGYVVMEHPNVDDVDELVLKINKIRYYDRMRA